MRILLSIFLLSSILLNEGVILLLSMADSPVEMCDHQVEENTEKEASEKSTNDPLKIDKYVYGTYANSQNVSVSTEMYSQAMTLTATNPTEVFLPPPERV